MAQGKRNEIAGNTATGLLKLIALGFMLCDHAGKMVWGNNLDMRVLGRIAFPLYCWCMVVGACRTRSMPRYMLRVALTGIISQPFYMVALDHAWNEPNIFLTLLLGLCALWGMKKRVLLSQIWAPVLALAAAQALGCDYGWRGVLLMVLLWPVKESKGAMAAVMIAYCMFWGSSFALIRTLFGVDLSPIYAHPWNSMLTPWLRIQALAVLALPFMLVKLPDGVDLRMPKWLNYSLYPMHLVVLMVMEAVMLPNGLQELLLRGEALLIRPVLALLGM